MRTLKARLTVTVDPGLMKAGHDAVSAGEAESLSAWVNAALAERAARDRRRRSLGDALAAYEAEFGVMTPEELAAQARVDRRSAHVVRGRGARPAKSGRRHGAA